jgi:hypothetical protein
MESGQCVYRLWLTLVFYFSSDLLSWPQVFSDLICILTQISFSTHLSDEEHSLKANYNRFEYTRHIHVGFLNDTSFVIRRPTDVHLSICSCTVQLHLPFTCRNVSCMCNVYIVSVSRFLKLPLQDSRCFNKNMFSLCAVYYSEINDRGNPLRWPRDTLYPWKLALLSQQAAVARSA